jgi:hypothetical protein
MTDQPDARGFADFRSGDITVVGGKKGHEAEQVPRLKRFVQMRADPRPAAAEIVVRIGGRTDLPYRLPWQEGQILSGANLTREDAVEFLAIAPKAGVRTTTTTYPFERANQALYDLRRGRIQGAAVLVL